MSTDAEFKGATNRLFFLFLQLNDICAKYGYEILKKLADEDTNISKRIEKLALEYLIEVDPDKIAESVFYDLDSLAVEDVWDNSGGTREGYVDPNELA